MRTSRSRGPKERSVESSMERSMRTRRSPSPPLRRTPTPTTSRRRRTRTRRSRERRPRHSRSTSTPSSRRRRRGHRCCMPMDGALPARCRPHPQLRTRMYVALALRKRIQPRLRRPAPLRTRTAVRVQNGTAASRRPHRMTGGQLGRLGRLGHRKISRKPHGRRLARQVPAHAGRRRATSRCAGCRRAASCTLVRMACSARRRRRIRGVRLGRSLRRVCFRELSMA